MKKISILLYCLILSHQMMLSKTLNQKVDSFFQNSSKAIEKEYKSWTTCSNPPVPVFTPPTIDALKSNIITMGFTTAGFAAMQAMIKTLQTTNDSLTKSAQNLTNDIIKMIIDTGSAGAVIGGVAAGVAGASMDLPPCAAIAGGAAAGAIISADMVDGCKIKYDNNQLTQLKAQILSNEFYIILLQACVSANLSFDQIQALTPAQIQAYSPAIITAIIPVLTPTQIATITPTQFASLTTIQLQILSPAQVAAVSPACIAALSPDMSPTQTAQLNALLTEIEKSLKNLPASAFTNMSMANKDLKKTGQALVSVFQQINSFISKAMNPQIAALTTAQIAGMTQNQINAISPLQIQVLSPEQFAAINATFMPSLTNQQIAAMNPFQILYLTKAQGKALTDNQIALLTIVQITEQIIGYFITPACFGGPE